MANTVKVSNLSLHATKRDIEDFFSFSGDIERIEVQRETEHSQVAYVTFKDPRDLETVLLLSGATIVHQPVNISSAEDPSLASPPPYSEIQTISGTPSTVTSRSGNAINKAQDIVTSMLAKGVILGKDAMNKAKEFDEKHGLTATASAKVSSFDKKIGFSEKISAGTAIVNEKVKHVDEKYQVSEKTKSTFAAAEQKVHNAGSTLMHNRYICQGASWVTGAFSRVAKAAEDVGMKTKAKIYAAKGSNVLSNDDSGHTPRNAVNANYSSISQSESGHLS